MWKSMRCACVAATVALVPMGAVAGKFDGSSPLVCAAFVAVACDADGECDRGTAETINVPEFFRIDLRGRKVHAIRADGSSLETVIQQVELQDGQIQLQGVEGDRGWTATLSEKSGKIAIAATGDRVGFFIFGACLASS